MAIGLHPAHGPTMTSVRPGASEGAHAAKLNTVLYHFYAKTVAVACESRAPSAPSAARANKWVRCHPLTQFSLSLGEIDRMRDRLRPWRAPSDGSVPRLCVDVRVRTSRLRADQVLVGCAPHGSGTRVVELGDAARTSVLLERWTVDLECVSETDTDPLRTISACPLYTSARSCTFVRCMRWRGRCLPRPCAVVSLRGATHRHSMSRSRCTPVRTLAPTISAPIPRHGRCKVSTRRSAPWRAASPIAHARSCVSSSVGTRCRAQTRRYRCRPASATSSHRPRAARARAP